MSVYLSQDDYDSLTALTVRALKLSAPRVLLEHANPVLQRAGITGLIAGAIERIGLLRIDFEDLAVELLSRYDVWPESCRADS